MKDFQQRISALNTGSASIEVRLLNEVLSEAISNIRMTLQLLGCFAILGIVVSGLGIYATTSLMVAARNRETGIRMAMGAQTWDILRLILWRGTRAILLGLPLGLFLAWILASILSSFLFHVKINDPFAWIASCTTLLGIMIIAAFIPALRATRANPLDIIRDE